MSQLKEQEFGLPRQIDLSLRSTLVQTRKSPSTAPEYGEAGTGALSPPRHPTSKLNGVAGNTPPKLKGVAPPHLSSPDATSSPRWGLKLGILQNHFPRMFSRRFSERRLYRPLAIGPTILPMRYAEKPQSSDGSDTSSPMIGPHKLPHTFISFDVASSSAHPSRVLLHLPCCFSVFPIPALLCHPD